MCFIILVIYDASSQSHLKFFLLLFKSSYMLQVAAMPCPFGLCIVALVIQRIPSVDKCGMQMAVEQSSHLIPRFCTLHCAVCVSFLLVISCSFLMTVESLDSVVSFRADFCP